LQNNSEKKNKNKQEMKNKTTSFLSNGKNHWSHPKEQFLEQDFLNNPNPL
jgi:hypothetical protein